MRVCLYRDYSKKVSPLSSNYSRKRTFDLCLFSETTIIIIEAKAQQGFDRAQLNDIGEDKKRIENIVGRNVDIITIALIASMYKPRDDTRNRFDLVTTWEDFGKLYDNSTMHLANKLFRQ